MRLSCFLILALFVLVPQVWCDDTNPNQEVRIQKLEQVIKDQAQKIDDLQKKVGTVENQPSREYTEEVVRNYMNKPEAKDEVTVAAGYDNGFFIKSSDGNFELFMTGYVQAGLAIFENATYEDNSFYPNGIYLAFDAYLYKAWHARIQFSMADLQRSGFEANPDNPAQPFSPSFFSNAGLNGITLQDAYAEYICMPEFQVRVGQTHVPFTMQGQYGQNEGITIWGEPFLAWSHGRDIGLMFMGTLSDMFEYKLGLFNGEGQNRLNNTDDMLMAGSIRLYPMKKSVNPNTFFHVGLMRNRDDRDVNYTLSTPWGRQVFSGFGDSNSTTHGWMTGVDVAARYQDDLDSEKINHLRAEIEFLYATWQRQLTTTGRLPYLQGYGVSLAFHIRHNLTPEVEGAGIFPLFCFSFTDIDNKETDDFTTAPGNTFGQRVFCYTFGLGYAFNSHVSAAFNWVMTDVEQKNLYGGSKERADVSDDVEHAWFLQILAQW